MDLLFSFLSGFMAFEIWWLSMECVSDLIPADERTVLSTVDLQTYGNPNSNYLCKHFTNVSQI